MNLNQYFATIIILIFSLLFTGCVVPKDPSWNWSESIQARKNSLTGSTTLEDKEIGWTLFSFSSPPSAQPIFVQRIDDTHWISVFEKPNKIETPKIQVLRVSDNEYRVILHRNNEFSK